MPLITVQGAAAAAAAAVSVPRLFYADQLDNPVNANWIVNALAPAGADSLNNALTIRAFDDTIEEGIGFILFIPSAAVNVILTLKSRAQTAPAGVRTVGNKLYYRRIPDDAAVSTTWVGANDGSLILNDISIPTNTNFQYDTQTIGLVAGFAPDVLAGSTYQFELTRVNPVAGTELVGDWNLLELGVEFT